MSRTETAKIKAAPPRVKQREGPGTLSRLGWASLAYAAASCNCKGHTLPAATSGAENFGCQIGNIWVRTVQRLL